MSKMSSVTLLVIVLSAVLYDTASGCTCSTSGTVSCDYINCLKGITAANNCSALQVTGASITLASFGSLPCSGTTTVTTTIVLMAGLPLLTYILSKN